MTKISGLSRLGLGCSRIGSFNNPQPLRESEALVRAAMDMGVTMFDTSNIYGQGDSERTLGRVLAPVREQAFILTKGGRTFSAKARALAWAKPVVRPLLALRGKGESVTARRSGELGANWSPAALSRSLEGSLKRLRSDCVDGFVLHSPPAVVAGDPAVHAELVSLRQQGKARLVGISCDDLAALEAALTMQGLDLLELPVDVLNAAGAVIETIRARGIVVVAREVIRLRPDLSPAEAVGACLAEPAVHCALVGTGKPAHLAQLLEHVA